MNVDDNHLVVVDSDEEMNKLAAKGYSGVPEDISLSAQLELMGKQETYVSKDSTGSVNGWAKKQREKILAKAKRRRMNKLCCR